MQDFSFFMSTDKTTELGYEKLKNIALNFLPLKSLWGVVSGLS